MALKDQRATAKANKKPNNPGLLVPTELAVTLQNEGAEAVATALAGSLREVFTRLSEQQAQATTQLHQMMMQHNATLLAELAKQTATLTKAVSRSIKVDSGDVEVNMPARPAALVAEYDEQGRIERFVPEYD